MRAADPAAWFDRQTGLPGSSFWDAVLFAESSRCARFGRPATVLFVAIGGVEDVIAQWGFEVIDRELLDLAAILRAGCRHSDYVVRMDDTRFGVLLTETDEIGAINVVERLRAKVDREIAPRLTRGRIAFGWASPRGKQRLLEMVEPAMERLRHEAAEGNVAADGSVPSEAGESMEAADQAGEPDSADSGDSAN
jgi:diguanylate cyclase (GGDEF)-like protein